METVHGPQFRSRAAEKGLEGFQKGQEPTAVQADVFILEIDESDGSAVGRLPDFPHDMRDGASAIRNRRCGSRAAIGAL